MQGFPQDKNKGLASGRGLGGVCDHIKEIGLWKAWGAAIMLKGPGENTDVYNMIVYVHMHVKCVNTRTRPDVCISTKHTAWSGYGQWVWL